MAAGSELQESTTLPPGRTATLRAPADANQVTVVAPDGTQYPVARSEQDMLQDELKFSATETPGVYQVRQGAEVIEWFAVDLFDRTESDLAVRPSQDPAGQTAQPADLRIGDIEVSATTSHAPSRRELWKVLLVCALFVLVLEWYIYNRRVYL